MTNDLQNLVNAEMPKVRTAFEKMMPQLMMALPKHITPERMVRVAMTGALMSFSGLSPYRTTCPSKFTPKTRHTVPAVGNTNWPSSGANSI